MKPSPLTKWADVLAAGILITPMAVKTEGLLSGSCCLLQINSQFHFQFKL